MYLVKVIVLAIVVNCVSPRPDGAPPLSCVNMQPGHIIPGLYRLAETQSSSSPYTFTAKWDRHERMVRVSVGGDGERKIQGFLIQGRLDTYKPAIGSFINISKNPNAQYQDCSLYPEVV